MHFSLTVRTTSSVLPASRCPATPTDVWLERSCGRTDQPRISMRCRWRVEAPSLPSLFAEISECPSASASCGGLAPRRDHQRRESVPKIVERSLTGCRTRSSAAGLPPSATRRRHRFARGRAWRSRSSADPTGT
jgi:hypothetical protein